MMFPSHLLGTLLVGSLVDRVRPLSPKEWRLALLFGVAIDLDHVLQVPVYVAQVGFAGMLQPMGLLEWGSAWQGFMHDPTLAVPVVLAASVATRSAIPVVFWGLHMVQDFVIAKHFVHFGSLEEWVIVAGLLATVTALFVAEHKARGARPFREHAIMRLGLNWWRRTRAGSA